MLFVHNLVGYEINIMFAINIVFFLGVNRFCNEQGIEGETSQLVMVLPTGARQKLD